MNLGQHHTIANSPKLTKPSVAGSGITPMSTSSHTSDLVTHTGQCHCGAVRFQVKAPPDLTAVQCNCSICSVTGHLHLLVEKQAFTLLTAPDQLTNYQFNTKTASHLFCKTCGIKSFYIPRSNPDGYSVNIRCLNPDTIQSITTQSFDGQNWEQDIHNIRDTIQ